MSIKILGYQVATDIWSTAVLWMWGWEGQKHLVFSCRWVALQGFPPSQQVQEKLHLFQQKSIKPGQAAPDFQQAALSLGLHQAPGAGSALSHLITWAGEQPSDALFLTHFELQYQESNYGSDSRKSWELGQDFQHWARLTTLLSFSDDKVIPDKEIIHRIQRMDGQNKTTAVLPWKKEESLIVEL